MSIEETPEVRPQDVEAARALLEENEFLRKDPYARRVVEAGGVVDNGEVVDLGDFLSARLGILEENKEKMAAAKTRNPQAFQKAMVVSSVRPDLEEK